MLCKRLCQKQPFFYLYPIFTSVNAPEKTRKPRLPPWLGQLAVFLLVSGLLLYGIWAVMAGPQERGLPVAIRRALEFNQGVNEGLVQPTHLVDTFPARKAVPNPRVNGNAGMGGPSDTAGYRFYLGKPGTGDTAGAPRYSLAFVEKLPHQDLIFDFKCVEGWSQITRWGGYRLADFARATGLASKTGQAVITGRESWAYKYVGLVTMDGGYYVGLDMPSALHPQTLLATEMSGRLLPASQGAPLRLMIPVKYGVKSIKKIGTIYASDEPPKDYWFERGYTYDLAL